MVKPAEKIVKPITNALREFMRMESAGGLLMLAISAGAWALSEALVRRRGGVRLTLARM